MFTVFTKIITRIKQKSILQQSRHNRGELNKCMNKYLVYLKLFKCDEDRP